MRGDDLAETIEGLIHATQPRSIRLKIVAEQSKREVVAGGKSRPLTLERTYKETQKGQRYYDDRVRFASGVESRKTSYSDGSKCANVVYDATDTGRQTHVSIENTFMLDARFGFPSKPDPVRLYHVGMTPLHLALPTAETLGTRDVIGRRCDDFRFKDIGPADRRQTLIYSLDRVTGLPLRVVSYKSAELLVQEKPAWTWEANSIRRVGDRSIVDKSTYSMFVVKKSADGEWESKHDMTQAIRVEEVAFDEVYPDGDFWPTIQPGVMVMDQIAGKTYQSPGPKPESKAAVGIPIRAEAPTGGSVIPWVGGGLSLIVLAVAAVLWKRAR